MPESNTIQFFNYHHTRIAYQYICYQEHAPVMIFLHDSLGCIQLWRDFPHKVATTFNYNLLIYDRLGYGHSEAMPTIDRSQSYMHKEAEVLHALISHLSISTFALFGHSDGASIALLYAALYPDHPQFIISEAAHVFVEDITLQGISNAVKAYQTTDLASKLTKYHGHKASFVFEAWTKTWLNPAFRTWDITALLAQITCPVLAIQGTQDAYGSLAQIDAILSLVQGKAISCIIPDCDHTPHKTNTTAVLNALTKFKHILHPHGAANTLL
jgi:pimeloyl-ACP methyl ester carboxylesterase